MDGRSVPDLDDVRAIAMTVLRHRVVLNFQAEAEGIGSDVIVEQVLRQVAAGLQVLISSGRLSRLVRNVRSGRAVSPPRSAQLLAETLPG
jgi:MoxR-like ATPase